MKDQIQDIKEELKNTMNDFGKELDSELAKRDLSPEDKAKTKEYFKAFIETFSSVHVTSQVIDSGQVQLDSANTKATVLSMIASFTMGDFFQSQKMRTHARKKRLASDATVLSQRWEICIRDCAEHTKTRGNQKDHEGRSERSISHTLPEDLKVLRKSRRKDRCLFVF